MVMKSFRSDSHEKALVKGRRGDLGFPLQVNLPPLWGAAFSYFLSGSLRHFFALALTGSAHSPPLRDCVTIR